MKATISVIIIVKDDPEIAVTLDELAAQTTPVKTEVIVVDRSAPNKLAAIRKQHSEAIWLRYRNTSGKRYSFAEQRNVGLAHAQGSLIVFVDCGCKLGPDWLATLYATAREHPQYLIASQLKPLGGYSAFETDDPADSLTETPEAPTNGLAVPRAVFDTVGGFDERFSYGEDTDLVWRARSAGFLLLRQTKAVIYHDWGGWRKDIRRSFRYGAARGKLYRKHPGHWRQLIGYDAVVSAYPLFILGLPLTLVFWPYPLLVLIPLLKNYRSHPFAKLGTYLVYGCGVIWGTITPTLAV